MKKIHGKIELREDLILEKIMKNFLHMLVISYGIKKTKALKGKHFRNIKWKGKWEIIQTFQILWNGTLKKQSGELIYPARWLELET